MKLGSSKYLNAGYLIPILLAVLAWSTAAPAQRKGSNESKQQGVQSPVRLPDEQVINQEISEMLAAWQIGDLQLLHSFYADDVTVVSGAYEPPLSSWANYAQAYQQQRERLRMVRLDRRNTYINVKGTFAWAAYQWEFSAMVDGKATSAHGQTTLILEKRKDRWLIVHNHTSIVAQAQAPETAPPSAPAKPGA